MPVNQIEITSCGKRLLVPCAEIECRTVIVTGGAVKIASIRDAIVAEGELVKNPATFVPALKQSGLKADVLAFFQRPPDVTPKFKIISSGIIMRRWIAGTLTPGGRSCRRRRAKTRAAPPSAA